VGSITGLAQWVKGSRIAIICSVDCRNSSNLALLGLQPRMTPAASVSLAWELPYATEPALKRQNKTKQKNKNKKKTNN